MPTESYQEEIKRYLFEKKIPETWLADKHFISPQTLNYQLNTAKKFDIDLYRSIKSILQKEGVLNNVADECQQLSRLALDFTAMIGNQLSTFTAEVSRDIHDHKLEIKERVRLKVQIDNMRENINSQLDQLEKLIEG